MRPMRGLVPFTVLIAILLASSAAPPAVASVPEDGVFLEDGAAHWSCRVSGREILVFEHDGAPWILFRHGGRTFWLARSGDPDGAGQPPGGPWGHQRSSRPRAHRGRAHRLRRRRDGQCSMGW